MRAATASASSAILSGIGLPFELPCEPPEPAPLVRSFWREASLRASSLEMALYKKPMVIAYILSPLMVKIMAWKSGQSAPLLPWIGLPNILLREFAVPEHLQEEVTPDKLMASCVRALEDREYIQEVQTKFQTLYTTLAVDTPRLAAEQIWRIASTK